MNILVTGSNGQLGNEMRLVSRNSHNHYIFTDVTEVEGVSTCHLDITDADAVHDMVKRKNIDIIVNCAAFTDVNGAESRQELAELLNATAPKILAEAMREAGGLLIHISTDYVFGGNPYNEPCKEEQKGTPTGVYGITKLQGEKNIKAAGCNYLIFRTAWLYSEFGKNFVKTMMQLTATKQELKVVFDQCGTPTYALDLARAIYNIIEECKHEGKSGIYHYSNEGVTSWYDFTKVIATMAGNTKCSVLPCHSDEFPSPVKRPAYSVLDKTKFKDTFGLDVPYWMDSLQTCINNIKQQKNG